MKWSAFLAVVAQDDPRHPEETVRVVTDPDYETWRNKYFNSLSALEKEQHQFRALEASLKRLAGRLCTASLGQSERLDEQVRTVQKALRREVTTEELDRITPALTEAIQELDGPAVTAASVSAFSAANAGGLNDTSKPAAAPSGPTIETPPAAMPTAAHCNIPSHTLVVANERVHAILSSLLVELRRDPELVARADALDTRLTAELPHERLADVLSPLAEMVGLRIRRIEHAKQEIEALLSHMVGKLDEIGQFVADQNQSQTQSRASSESLNAQLADDVRAMGESVEFASDLQQLRRQVRSRLDSIDRHLEEFRQREAALAETIQTRSEKLHARVAELEAEAKRLHHQLQDQQRLSMTDALTGIPNRLAYQSRMEDELRRWQRFKQPVCLAIWDVDHFKRINDTYGHRAGDRVLRTVAESLALRIRSTDFLARYGGEEFVMILPGTLPEDAVRLVETMRRAVAQIGFHFRGTPISITVSAGVTALEHKDTSATAFDRADKALYQAKQGGRNRCTSI